MNEELSMKLPTEVVERAVRDKINAAIAAQLGDSDILIKNMVGAALNAKVSSNGNVSKNGNDNRFNFLEVTADKFIREAAHEALKEYFEENKAKIKNAVKKEVAKSPTKLAKVFMDGIFDSINSTYTSSVSISFKTNR